MPEQRNKSLTKTYRLDANPSELKFREEILHTGKFSDVSFLIGEQQCIFKAHRLILMAGSQVFKDMLTRQSEMKEIAITDLHPNNFQQLLNVIYLNCFEIFSHKMATECMHLFHHHNLKSAVRICQIYLARGKEPTQEKSKSRRRRRYGKTLPPQRKEEERFWRPTFLRKNNLRSEEEMDTDELYCKLRGALNKLTNKNFNILVMEVMALMSKKINTYDQAKRCIKLILVKASSEPMYCSMYAYFCKLLAPVWVVSYGLLTFGQILQNYSLEVVRQIDLDNLDELSETEEKRAIATMIFYGEIFKLLSETSEGLIVSFTDMMLDLSTNNSLEGLCELLIRIGECLQSKAQYMPEIFEIFEKLKDLSDNASKYGLSNKTRFAIMDVIELRNDHWEPRREGMINKIVERIFMN